MNSYICFAKSENVLAFNLTECFFFVFFSQATYFYPFIYFFFGNILLEAAVTLGL